MYEGQKPISHAGSLVAKLRPSLAFFPLDDDWVVFSEESQSLVALNATAGFLVRKLQEGAPSLTDSLVAEMGVAPRDAQGWVSATLDALSSQGLLDDGRIPVPLPMDNAESDEEIARRTADMPALAPYTPCVEGRYRLLGTCVLIRYAHGAQMRMVDTVIGHLKADENTAPTLAIDITGVPTREWPLHPAAGRGRQRQIVPDGGARSCRLRLFLGRGCSGRARHFPGTSRPAGDLCEEHGLGSHVPLLSRTSHLSHSQTR
jgi:hypothetical protein